jgi:hypothetical protein
MTVEVVRAGIAVLLGTASGFSRGSGGILVGLVSEKAIVTPSATASALAQAAHCHG